MREKCCRGSQEWLTEISIHRRFSFLQTCEVELKLIFEFRATNQVDDMHDWGSTEAGK